MNPGKKAKQAVDDFHSRAERLKKHVEIPQGDDRTVIVPPNNEGVGFKFTGYKDHLLRGRVDKQMFDSTVKEANRICENVWRRKKLQETEDFAGPLKSILYWAVIISLIAFGFLFLVVYAEGDDMLLYGAILMISIASGLTMMVVVKALIAQPYFIELENEIMHQLTAFFEDQNRSEYYKRGCYWVIEPRFYWLELHLGPRKS